MARRTLTLLLAAAEVAGPAAVSPQGAESAAPRLDVIADVGLLPGSGATLRQRGTFTGAPLGSGTVTVRTKLTGTGARIRFVMSNARGSVRGRGSVGLHFSGLSITYTGSARITGGSGAYAGMRAHGLRVAGSGRLTGGRFRVGISGPYSG